MKMRRVLSILLISLLLILLPLAFAACGGGEEKQQQQQTDEQAKQREEEMRQREENQAQQGEQGEQDGQGEQLSEEQQADKAVDRRLLPRGLGRQGGRHRVRPYLVRHQCRVHRDRHGGGRGRQRLTRHPGGGPRRHRRHRPIPDDGFHVGGIVDNGVAVPPADPYVITDVRQDHEVVVTFVKGEADWYLAEGSTDGGMETWVLVQNPGPDPVLLDLTLMTGSGARKPAELQGVALPGFSRISFNLGAYVTSYDLSTMVSARGGDVICERAMYGGGRTWGTDSLGVTAPSTTWYLAEGCTGGDFETFLLVQNPSPDPVLVSLDFMTSVGGKAGPQAFAIPGTSRYTFKLNDYVTDYDLSTLVTASGSVVCERSMFGGGRTWAHDSVGVTAPSDTWYLAEGCTDGGMETFVLVQNPSPTAVEVSLDFMTGAGAKPGPQDFLVAGNSRHTFKVNDFVTDYNVSTLVTSARGPVICERAMYGGGRNWAHNSNGYDP